MPTPKEIAAVCKVLENRAYTERFILNQQRIDIHYIAAGNKLFDDPSHEFNPDSYPVIGNQTGGSVRFVTQSSSPRTIFISDENVSAIAKDYIEFQQRKDVIATQITGAPVQRTLGDKKTSAEIALREKITIYNANAHKLVELEGTNEYTQEARKDLGLDKGIKSSQQPEGKGLFWKFTGENHETVAKDVLYRISAYLAAKRGINDYTGDQLIGCRLSGGSSDADTTRIEIFDTMAKRLVESLTQKTSASASSVPQESTSPESRPRSPAIGAKTDRPPSPPPKVAQMTQTVKLPATLADLKLQGATFSMESTLGIIVKFQGAKALHQAKAAAQAVDARLGGNKRYCSVVPGHHAASVEILKTPHTAGLVDNIKDLLQPPRSTIGPPGSRG